MLSIITPHTFFDVISFLCHTQLDISLYTIILSIVGHSQYIIILTSCQYHSIIAIHYCHRKSHRPMLFNIINEKKIPEIEANINVNYA